ncbi:low molecular weight protein arginine phosphatase [Clostridium algidicarnis]|uniref:Protein-tyrosine phosphatase n=2 Tax=Clostridium algidicarnis TaxID=37659 RepID=A0A2S6FZ92_9CLOT|nr:low molecular weight protein arginine phosphatase [Clostridium algidicarnis]MBB6698177.1 low molecular weight protein arginine phosphatase [Clostridium algidicarnis]MBU3194218.1 low molecular weight protein arginine phosphatase [Clostridium algidicarnis]MBU3195057.1 low molecular weight protein arginine phosphatase [Clostridium algidicarnis]MBU3203773.1 low molecular weight protein arginine phosphatase [Clostridium algidicarnis]MBU3211927.1 low molecular weight protein arginine phosphatase 
MNILFVCTGNTCRSCMAEAIFNYINDNKNLCSKSVGLSIVKDSVTSLNSAEIIKSKLGLDLSNRKAVQFSKEDIENSNIVLTMTLHMKDMLINAFPKEKEKIFTLNEYVGVNGDIIDPYGGTMAFYEKTFFDLEKSIRLLLEKLKGDRV